MAREQEQKNIQSAVNQINQSDLLEVDKWSKHGCEHFHRNVGEYWLPPSITVTGDMNDLDTLTVLSQILDDNDLEIHVHHGIQEHGEEWARLVPDIGGN